MNSRDPWREIIGGPHGGGGHHHHGGGGGGGGHHHHGGGGRRFFGGGGGYSYPYYPTYPLYYDPYAGEAQIRIIDNRIVKFDRWGRATIIGLERGIPYVRDGVLGEVAPILAPGSGGLTAVIELDKDQRLHAQICVDGECYKADINLAPAIALVMKKLADQHAAWHAQGQPQVKGWDIIGVGDCGGRMFKGVNDDNLNKVLNRLRDKGASISGSNPVWEVDTRITGVKFKGTYYKALGKLMLEVTDSAWNEPCFAVWNEIEPMLNSLGITRDSAHAMHTVKAMDNAVHAAGEGLVDSLVGYHEEVICGGWFGSLKKGVKNTLRKHKGKIAKAAGMAAAAAASSVPGGAVVAPMADKIANKVVDKAIGDNKAKKDIEEVKESAKTDPDVAKAYAIAKKQAAKVLATVHVADTAKEAVEGNHEAKQEIAKIEDAAEKGDKAAKVAVNIADEATDGKATRKGGKRRREQAQQQQQTQVNQADPMPKEEHPQSPPPTTPQAISDPGHLPDGSPDPWANTQTEQADTTKVQGEIPGGELASYRRTATQATWDALQRRPSAYLGYRRIGHHQRVYLFGQLEDANKWYGALAPGYTYAAVFDAKQMEANSKSGSILPLTESMERVDWTLPTKVGDPRVEIIGAVLATVRKQALDAARSMPHPIAGIVRWADGNWSMDPFESTDLADDWLGDITRQPRLFTYAAYYDKNDRTWPGPMNEKFGASTPKPQPTLGAETMEARPLVRVPVIDEQHIATRQFALWVLPYAPPDFYMVHSGGDMWLFLDPNGSVEVNGRRYRPDYPAMKATLTGDPGRRKEMPRSNEIPGMA